jgi:glycosyltransferase involved in cell wall biosynthesis
VWEQTILPVRASRTGLWSPCNFGPVAHRRHVVTVHDTALFDHPEWFSSKYATVAARIQGFLLHRARIVVPSAFTASRVTALAPRADVHVIPWATMLPLGDRPVVPSWYTGTPFVLSVGSVQPRKNFRSLVRAWEKIGPRVGEVELLVVGAADPLFARDTAGAGHGVRFLGYVADEELAWLYGNCRAYVNMSRYEGFGLTPLEAATHGAPVVASAIPAHHEVLAGTGARLVDLDDDDALVESLLEAVAGVLPRAHTGRTRSWSDVATEYDEFLTRTFS